MKNRRKVFFSKFKTLDKEKILEGIRWCGRLDDIHQGVRVLIKPNLTFPFYKPGVTTSPDLIRTVTELLLDHGAQVTICEGGPSLDVFSMENSFADHGILQLKKDLGIRVLDLRNESIEHHHFSEKSPGKKIPLPRILNEIDLFVSLPLFKVHAMTTISLSLKNQWGLIPVNKRFLFHPDFDGILNYINSKLPKPLVICDGRIVLDENGPMFGKARRGEILGISSDLGAFDFVASKLMGFDPLKIKHIRAGIQSGMVPSSLGEIDMNVDPVSLRPFQFMLRRTLQNYIALAGFKSRLICKLGYDSPVSDLLHKILYRIKGNPLTIEMQEKASGKKKY